MSEPPPPSALVRFFERLVSRPVAVAMLTIALLGMGLIAAARIPIQLIPNGFQDDSISVSAEWPGANPTEIERRILKPLERELRSVQGLEDLYAVARNGSASLELVFPGNLDMDQVYAEVADRVERARSQLPAEVDRILLRKGDPSAMPVMFLGISVPEEMDWERAQDLFANVLVPRLEAVDGVAEARPWGVMPQSVRIWLDEERVLAQRVDVRDLVTRLQGDNVSSPVGDLDDGGSRYILRVDSRFDSLEEIEDFPVRPGLAIRDVGRVEMVRSAPEFWFRFEGDTAISVSITKESSANTFALTKRLRRLIEEELPRDPVLGAFGYLIYFDQGRMIGASLADLVRDAAYGGLIALAVLFLFLRRLSDTLLITLSIPMAVLLTLAYLYFSGGSLNLLTMMGIAISVGMLVDNSVVIVESIIKKREEGAPPFRAATRGPAEMMLAIVTATATTIAVFLPFMFLSEDRNAQVMSRAIGGPLCVSLAFALLLAVVVAPTASNAMLKRARRAQSAVAPRTPRLRRAFGALAGWSVRNRFPAALLALLVLSTWPLTCIGTGFTDRAAGMGGQERVDFDILVGGGLAAAAAEVEAIEEPLRSDEFAERFPDIAWGTGFGERSGQLMLWPETTLKPDRREELMTWLEEHLPRRPGLEYHFGGGSGARGRTDQEWTRVRIEGPDSDEVARLLARVREAAERSPDFVEVSKGEDLAREVTVRLDRERMSRLGIPSQAVLGNIEWNLRGFMVSRYQQPHADVPIVLEYDQPEDPSREDLVEMAIGTAAGMVPLATLAEFSASRAPSRVVRRNGVTSDSLGLRTREKDMKKVHASLAALMAEVEFPEGYHWEQEGGWNEFQDQMADLFRGLALAVALVFLLMGVLFDSLILPLCAILTVPFGILGARWAYLLTDTPIGMLETIALAVVAGVVVNNGIVLIDRILHLEGSGMARAEAVVQAVRDRLRPVVMTTLTTVCGLLPIALSEPSGEGFSFQGLAIGVIGGITASTFFTLWTVPLSYSLMRSLGETIGAWFRPVRTVR